MHDEPAAPRLPPPPHGFGAPTAAPTLPAVDGPPRPAVVPYFAEPQRAWEQPGSAAATTRSARSARIARYGEPVAPVGRAVLACIAVGVAVVGEVLLALAFRARRQAILDGEPISVLDRADDRVVGAAVSSIGVLVVAGVFVIAWTYRAYRTTAAFVGVSHRLRWAILGWIVPFVNLVAPARIVAEIAAGGRRRERGKGLVIVWWLAWVVPAAAAWGLQRYQPTDLDDVASFDLARFTLSLCTAVAGVLLIVVIARSTIELRRRVDEHRADRPAA